MRRTPTNSAQVLAAATGTPAIYFALPPAVTEKVVETLSKMKLPTGIVLALEKPFGTDLRSARALNRLLASFIPEKQVHRVDHFLGKSTVLNILGLRFANRLFEESWNASNIERVEISYDEQLGLEGRAGYYDHAGALIDMIQSHLLQVLAVVAMEPPSTLDSDDLRGAMAQVLRATRVWKGDVKNESRRGRYTAGTIGWHEARLVREAAGRRSCTRRPRRWRKLRSPSTTGAGRGCRSCCARARRSRTTAKTSSSPSARYPTCRPG